MSSPLSSTILFALAAILAFAVFVRLVSADTGTSTNFNMSQSINDFGGTSTSTSFQSDSTGGQVVSGTSSSNSFMLDTGFQYYDTFAPKSQNWRWYDDETSETPTLALENENVAPIDIENDEPIKLRITVKETAGYGSTGVKFRLQFSTVSDFSSDVGTLAESGSCIFSSTWCYADGADTDGDIISTALLSDADTCSGGVGDGCGTHNESGNSASTFTQNADAATEYEFTLKASGVSPSVTYFFRLYNPAAQSGVPFNTGESYPSLVTGGSTLSFSVSGIPASTPVAGVTTDVDSTSTDISFGTLPFGTPLHAAQQLSVTTNAATGYEVFVFQPQGFLGEQGADITPISGTNASPASWGSACLSSSPGCFGYHTSEAVLAGGSTRFAADDTYARFSQYLEEVAYSATAANDKTTDIVYKVQAHDMQDADNYSTTLSYIVVPVF